MRRYAGAVLLLTGALIVLAGSTRPLYEVTRLDSGYRSGYRATLWGGEYTTPDGYFEPDPVPIRYGVPVVVAAVLLVLVAVLVLLSSRLPARLAVPTRVGAVAAAALLVGSVWTVGQVVLVWTGRDDPVTGMIVTTVGHGMWVLVAASALVVVGSVLVQRRPAPPVRRLPDDDTDTPPMGIPIRPPASTEDSPPG